MKKIIHFIHGLSMGGAETLVKDYCLGLDKTKYEVMVLCSVKYGCPYEKILEKQGIKCVYVNDYTNKKPLFINKLIIHFLRYLKIKKILNNEKPDILHIHLNLCKFVKFSKVKCDMFYTVHNKPDFVWENDYKEEKAVRWLIKNRNLRMITLSQEMKKEIDKRFNINNSLILNNGINFDRFTSKIDKSDYRCKIGIPEDSFVVGNVARFSDEKNHLLLIDIFKNLLLENKNAFLLLIGDGELKESIKNKLDQNDLKGKYLILSNRTDIPELMKCMDFFVLTSKVEGLGIVLIEAQISGLKCIAPLDVVPKETQLSNLIIYESIMSQPIVWAKKILSFNVNECTYNGIEDWNMINVVCKLQGFYNNEY